MATRVLYATNEVSYHLNSERSLIVGDPPQWSDNSDATYAQLNAENILSGSATTLIDPQPDLRVSPQALVRVRFRVSSIQTGPIGLVIQLSAGGTVVMDAGYSSASSRDVGWETVTLTGQNGWTVDEWLVWLQGNGSFLNFVSETHTRASTVDHWYIYEAEVHVSYPVGLPPCRQWPRADGLRASSARRQYPPDKSLQASPRHAGVYW